MAAISCLYFGSLPFYKDWINVRLRLCYCCSALCLTLIQSWGTLVVTGKDDNCSGFSNAKFAIMSACRLSCLVTRERVTHENQNANAAFSCGGIDGKLGGLTPMNSYARLRGIKTTAIGLSG